MDFHFLLQAFVFDSCIVSTLSKNLVGMLPFIHTFGYTQGLNVKMLVTLTPVCMYTQSVYRQFVYFIGQGNWVLRGRGLHNAWPKLQFEIWIDFLSKNIQFVYFGALLPSTFEFWVFP